MKNIKSILVALFAVMIFSWLLMVTRFEYVGDETRFNRLSGGISVLLEEEGWTSLARENDKFTWLKDFPEGEESNVTGTARFTGTTFKATIENNSDWKIDEMDFEVRIYSSADSTVLTRRYFTGKSLSELEGTPFTITKYIGNLPRIGDEQYFGWHIPKIRGHLYSGKHGE